MIVRAFWPGRGGPTQKFLSEIRVDSKCLESECPGAAPTSFEVVVIRELAGRFSGPRTFIEDLEKLIPEFYDQIGYHLRPWVPPPPSIDKRDPIQDADIVEASEERSREGVLQSESDIVEASKERNADIVEASEERNGEGVSQSESDQSRVPQEPSDTGVPSAEDR